MICPQTKAECQFACKDIAGCQLQLAPYEFCDTQKTISISSNAKEVEDFNLFTSPLDHPVFSGGSVSIDWTELERLHSKATSGEWNIDTEKNEGDYGSGDPDDVRTGFESYVLHAPSGSICDTLNSDLICVNEESDDEGTYAWDEVGERNMKWVAAIHNAFPAILAERQAMLAKLEAAQRLRDELKQIMEKPVTSMTDGADRFAFIYSALAAFDKEQQ